MFQKLKDFRLRGLPSLKDKLSRLEEPQEETKEEVKIKRKAKKPKVKRSAISRKSKKNNE